MKGKKLTAKELKAKLEQDKKKRIEIFKELCAHLKKGYSLDCFVPLSEQSIRTYLTKYPEEFDRAEFELSLRQAKQSWEDIGYRQSTGSCVGNSRSWYYNMVNRYGWREKIDIEAEHKGDMKVSIVSYATQKTSKKDSKE